MIDIDQNIFVWVGNDVLSEPMYYYNANGKQVLCRHGDPKATESESVANLRSMGLVGWYRPARDDEDDSAVGR